MRTVTETLLQARKLWDKLGKWSLSHRVLWKGTTARAKGKLLPSREFPRHEVQNTVTACSGFPWLNASTPEKPIGFSSALSSAQHQHDIHKHASETKSMHWSASTNTRDAFRYAPKDDAWKQQREPEENHHLLERD